MDKNCYKPKKYKEYPNNLFRKQLKKYIYSIIIYILKCPIKRL